MSSSIHAEVSSITDTVGGLRERVAALAPTVAGADHDDLLGALFEAERSLAAAARHLERAKRLTGR